MFFITLFVMCSNFSLNNFFIANFTLMAYFCKFALFFYMIIQIIQLVVLSNFNLSPHPGQFPYYIRGHLYIRGHARHLQRARHLQIRAMPAVSNRHRHHRRGGQSDMSSKRMPSTSIYLTSPIPWVAV